MRVTLSNSQIAQYLGDFQRALNACRAPVQRTLVPAGYRIGTGWVSAVRLQRRGQIADEMRTRRGAGLARKAHEGACKGLRRVSKGFPKGCATTTCNALQALQLPLQVVFQVDRARSREASRAFAIGGEEQCAPEILGAWRRRRYGMSHTGIFPVRAGRKCGIFTGLGRRRAMWDFHTSGRCRISRIGGAPASILAAFPASRYCFNCA